MSSPFVLEPVQSPDEFQGRHYEVRRASSFLRQKQNVSVVGAAKMGKTSMLNVLSHQKTVQQYSLSEHLFVRVEGRELDNKSKEQCLYHICSCIHQQLPLLSYPRQNIRFADLQTMCREATRLGKKLIIVFDQFEGLTSNPQLDVDFFNGLRALSSAEFVTFLTASSSPLYELQQGHMDRLSGSPFFNVFQQIDLKPLAKEDCQAILRQIFVAETELAGVFDMIVGWANGRPYHLKFAGYHAAQLYHRQYYGNSRQWNEACTRNLRKKMADLD